MSVLRGFLPVFLFAVGISIVAPEEKDSASDESKESSDKKASKGLQEFVIVTASRIATPISQVGNSVTVITREDMERKQYRFVLDALREVPGIDIRQTGGPGTLTSVFTRGTDSDHTLLLVDGIQVHDVSSPNGAAVLSNLLVSQVDRIEVVRGPQSTLYGSDAIGGVVNVITSKGSGESVVTFSAEAGSFNTFVEHLQFGRGGSKTNQSVAITRVDSDGFSARANDPDDDPYRNTSVSGRFGFDPSEDFGIDFFMRYIDANVDIDSGTDPTLSETKTEQTLFKAQPHWDLVQGRWTSKLGVWIHDIQRDNQGTGFVLPSKFRGTIYGIDWQNDLNINKNNVFIVGSEFERQESENEVTGFPRIDVVSDNVGFYIQDQFQWRDKLTGTAGIRVDSHKKFGEKATYRLTGAYHLKKTDTIFRGSVGTGFKAPSLDELFDSTFGSNNPDLNPEESMGWDLGLEQLFIAGNLSFGATYFYNDIDNMIVAVFNGMNFQSVNIERVVTEGIETFVDVQPVKRLGFRWHYTYTDTEAKNAASFGISDGSQLLRRPRHKSTADFQFRILPGTAQVSLGLIYVGERQDLDPITFGTVTADDYFLVNLSGSYRIGKRLEIFGRIHNLLDEDYEDVLGFNTAGFSLFGGVRISL